MIQVLDDVVVDEPLLGFIDPVLIVESTWAGMREQLALDGLGDEILFVEIFDAVVGVASDAHNYFWIEDLDGFLQVLKGELLQLGLWCALRDCFVKNKKITKDDRKLTLISGGVMLRPLAVRNAAGQML